MRLSTPRLNLRFYNISDADFILRLLNEPSFLRYIGDRKVRTTSDATEYIQTRLLDSYAKNGYGLYMVETKQDAIPVGMCGLVKRKADEDPDIGFAFLPEYWKQGYALEAARAVLDYARNSLQLKRLLGITIPDNESSVRTLEKLGLRYVRQDANRETGEALSVYEIAL